MALRKTKEVWEFGDFQTPDLLANHATEVIKKIGIEPKSIIEPTCGRGAFLLAAAHHFPNAKAFVGVEINKTLLNHLHDRIAAAKLKLPLKTFHANFFTFDWFHVLDTLNEPILVIGNPPWVTSSELSILNSTNIPGKSNFLGFRGIEALTGKSNFDISEWMLLRHIAWMNGRTGVVAMLCKTAVARKVLTYAWKHSSPINTARIYRINTKKYFNTAVDGCFFVLEFNRESRSQDCYIYENLSDVDSSYVIGYHSGIVVANIPTYKELKHLQGIDKSYIWRSGIKHDCTKIMELEKCDRNFRSGNGDITQLEDTYVYPMLKSSDLSNGRIHTCRKYMLVTQKHVAENTDHIQKDAPKTWRYLQNNADLLEKRASSIYRNRPPFSIFGIGDYTFAPWKVAISGFYKHIRFMLIGPVQGKPVVFDDTIYFLPCYSEEEAIFIVEMLNSDVAQQFLASMVFWSDKRPITIDLLKRLNIGALAHQLRREDEYLHYRAQRLQTKLHVESQIMC